MTIDDDLHTTPFVQPSPRRPGRSARAPAAARAALVLAALLVLALALAPRAGAALYWTNAASPLGGPGTTIGRGNNDGTGVNQNFIGGASSPEAVVVDAAHVYWINETDGHSIARANLDGTGVNQRFITGVNAGSLAVDGAHIYWTTSFGDNIGRANLDGTGIEPAFITGHLPGGVAVDRGHVYWTNTDVFTQGIGRANLDGTGVNQSFIGLDLGRHPLGIAVDAAHLYWVDLTNRIGRANIDGTAVNADFVPTGPFPSRVAVDSAHIYWHNQFPSPDGLSGGTIGRANLDGTGVTQTLVTGLADPLGVAVDVATQAAPASRISIGDVRMAEGDAGQTTYRFTVALDQSQSAPVTVDYATADGTATAPSDYAATTGTLTFAAGETAKTVTVQVNGDTAVEPDETFNVNLANATGNATIADATGAGTIVNDDQPAPASRISIGDVSMAEGNAGQSAFRFTVSLDTARSAPVTVDYATADGTAAAPGDYAATTGTVTFALGETAKTVTVQVNGDTRKESDETFRVNLSNPTGNATIADGQAVGTIVNDDRRRPWHKFTLGKARLNPDTGTATLAVTVPGPGTLASAGPGAKAPRAIGLRPVRAAGIVWLPITASGEQQRTLNRTGTVTIRPRVTYTPIGGTPRTRSKHVQLQKR